MKITRIIATSTVAACLIATSVFAVNTPSPSTSAKTPTATVTPGKQKTKMANRQGMVRKGHKGFHCNKLDELVTAKTITAEQKTAVENAIKAAREAKKDVKEALDALVKAGTITQAQEDAIIKSMPMGRGSKGLHGSKMDELVTSGTITQGQKDAIVNAVKTAWEAKKDVKEALDALVKAGTITQAQEDAVINAMLSGKGKHMRMHKDNGTVKPSASPTAKAQ